ncbi:TonB-linked outer membrane protein, SusC/RagA family [Chitinophaga jiangningensis]|uniref:TonB-linked outer membrane protein, SusC/RagA family n=1 Tax=Chitinophaga jiangningensis TaxID=1419482 RepID=A0A1M7LT69_9BACT|nr:TonB-dependent receptor [Chitinophaga jiangningensis]SHM81498.1 TonB-linked outer membrane protein, SusC/RagA family [Chitinophaga jiangningensis]
MKKIILLWMHCAALLLICSMPLQQALAQDPAKINERTVTLSGKHLSFLQVFSAIRKQTKLTMVYSNQLLNDNEEVSVDFHNTPLPQVLEALFKDRNITYGVQRNRIVLDKKLPTPAATIPQADEWQLRGQVMDVRGGAIPGATVSMVGTSKGVVTDPLGGFTLPVDKNSILRIAMVGMNPEEVQVGQRRTLKVTLTEKVDKLNEVVVVGFGNQRKVTVTGAVSTVNMADMRTPVPSLTNALAGKVAGVISMQSAGGEPGYDNPQFTIRGIGTFTGSTSPLIIVDGVQRSDINSTFGGAFNNIDPEDVASISLLKDASATAVYGAKGANGVLIITTKRGVAGTPKISAKAETGWSGLTQKPRMVDGVTYMKLYNEAKTNAGEAPAYNDEIIAKTASGLDPYIYPNVNWLDRIYKDWTAMTNANLNVSGGGESMRYYVSMSFYNQDGQYKVSKVNGYNPNLNFKRYDFRSNVDMNVTKTTVLSLNIAAMLVNSRYPGNPAGGIWYAAYATNPIAFPVSYPDNKWAGPRNNGGVNPFNLVQNSGYSTEFKPSVQSVVSVTQRLDAVTKGLSATGRFSFDTYGEFNTSRHGYNDLWYAGGRDENGELIYERTRTGNTYLGYSTSSSGERVMYIEGNLTYDRNFGNHTVGALVVGSLRNRVIGTASGLKMAIPFRNQNMAARVTYSFKDKYLAELNMGATGSENFEKGQRWGYFPAASAGWVISKEEFFQPATHTFNLFKLRASYGMTGNDQLADNNRFGYLTYIDNSGGIAFGATPRWNNGIAATVFGTENLTWEKSAKTDIGLELGIRNKLTIIADYFQDHRNNILVQRGTISPVAGYGDAQIFANMGEMINKGVDASIEYIDRIGKNVSLRLFGNITYARNKVIYADRPVAIFPYQQFEGHMNGEQYGYIAQGYYNTQEEIDKSPAQLRKLYPGDIRYADLNADGKINAGDQTYLGKSSFPLWSYGYGFTVGYRKWELSTVFAGVADVAIMANGAAVSFSDWGASGVGVIPFAGMGQYPANVLTALEDRWTKENPRQDAAYPRLTVANTSDNNYVSSSHWIRDGSFMRLKQATLSYSFITPMMKKRGVSNLTTYVTGTNLLTLSKFKLWDPELGSNGAKYPFARTVTVGVRAQF